MELDPVFRLVADVSVSVGVVLSGVRKILYWMEPAVVEPMT